MYIRPDGTAFVSAGEYVGVLLDATAVADLAAVAVKAGTRTVEIAADVLSGISARTVIKEGVEVATNGGRKTGI